MRKMLKQLLTEKVEFDANEGVIVMDANKFEVPPCITLQ